MSDMNTEDSHEPQRPTPPSPHPPGVVGFFMDAFEDIRAVMRSDPAATNPLEVVLTYPGLHALWSHRVAHRLYGNQRRTTARIMSHVARHYTGIEIHPGAQIGRRVFIDHGMGVVIGETAVIGDDCLIYKGVVLGGTSLKRTKRHPTLGKGVVVGSNACVLGAVEIGDGARVGSGSVVIRDVPASGTVVGIPGRVVAGPQTTVPSDPESPDLDHAALPDPVQRMIRQLVEQVERLQHRLHAVEHQVELEPEALAERLGRDERQRELDEQLATTYAEDKMQG
jgi:serine O-acetyltransferase